MRVAVIIPSYNHARYLETALESVFAQTRRPDRVIVIDDGSSDDSPAVIRAWGERGVEGACRENRGAHNTLNELVGRAAADCDVVSILNSDDLYAPERFATCLPVLENRPEVQVVTSALRVIDDAGAPLAADEPRARWFRAAWSLWDGPETDLCAWLGTANFPATTSNLMVRTAWLQRFPFRPYRFNHDYYFLAQTILRGAMEVVPQPLVNYRVHGSNTMNTDPAPLMAEMLRMNLDLARHLAPELAANPALRARFASYSRALWDSISSLHAGVLQALLAEAAARLTDDEAEAAARAVAGWPELAAWPNRSLVNEWKEDGPVTAARGLAARHDALRAEHRTLRDRERAGRDTAAVLGRLTKSRWLAIGRAVGLWSPPSVPSAPPETRAARLEAAIRRHWWLRLGRSLGIDPVADAGRGKGQSATASAGSPD